MRRRLIESPSLYVGDMADCAAVDGEWSVVHACRLCFANKVGPPQKGEWSRQEGQSLWLNFENRREPDYTTEPFTEFLKFAKAEIASKRPMLIHCEHGHSRAPMLALLFLAKVLHRIRNGTLDEAWADFEKVAGERFSPAEGLEIWMRDHWRELDLEKPKEPEVPKVLTAKVDFRKLTPAQNRAIIEENPLIHFAACLEIEKKDNVWARPVPNILQRKIAEAYAFCMAKGIPCRLVILKPRQVGCSTFCVALGRAHSRRLRCDMLILSDTDKRVQLLWRMLQGFNSHDSFPWKSRITKQNTEVVEITFPDGEVGRIKHDTAADDKAGTGGTRQVIIWNEASKYERSNARDKKVFSTSLISLANVPNSVGIMESTADGSSGIFHETFKGAVPLADRKAGRRNEDGQLLVGNNFISVFAAWHEFEEYRLERSDETSQWFAEELDDRERRGIDLYGWTREQIAWRRATMKKECNGDINQMDQEFPEDPEIAFLASGRPRFDRKGLTQMEMVARQMHSRAELMTLERAGSKEEGPVAPHLCADHESWLWVSERPQYGRSYICSLDPCTGEQAAGSPFPDSHGVQVWRAGFHERNKWFPPKLVAAIFVPTGCRWDEEVLADRVKRITDWYGGCMVIPEVNKSGILHELRRVGCTIYQREKMDAMYPGKKLLVAGWETNQSTRPLLVNAVANYVREYSVDDPSFEVHFLPLIEEMKTFVVNESGKAEAKHGTHDDQVMTCGLSLYSIDLATPYTPPYSDGDGGGWPRDRGPVTLPGGLNAAAFS